MTMRAYSRVETRIAKSRAEGEGEMSRRPDTRWMRAEDDQLRAAAASGETAAAISKRLCRSESGVRHRAEKIGIKFASRQRFRSPRLMAKAK
jgi:hypothetical protein